MYPEALLLSGNLYKGGWGQYLVVRNTMQGYSFLKEWISPSSFKRGFLYCLYRAHRITSLCPREVKDEGELRECSVCSAEHSPYLFKVFSSSEMRYGIPWLSASSDWKQYWLQWWVHLFLYLSFLPPPFLRGGYHQWKQGRQTSTHLPRKKRWPFLWWTRAGPRTQSSLQGLKHRGQSSGRSGILQQILCLYGEGSSHHLSQQSWRYHFLSQFSQMRCISRQWLCLRRTFPCDHLLFLLLLLIKVALMADPHLMWTGQT